MIRFKQGKYNDDIDTTISFFGIFSKILQWQF